MLEDRIACGRKIVMVAQRYKGNGGTAAAVRSALRLQTISCACHQGVA